MDTAYLGITFIKYFGIILSCFYIFGRALNCESFSAVKMVIACLTAAALALLMCLLQGLSILRFLILTLLCGLFMSLMTRTKLDLAVTATGLSAVISYLLFAVLSLILGLLFILADIPTDVRVYIAIFIIQLLLTPLPFQIRRFKRGFPFLKRPGAGWVGIFISGLIIVLYGLAGILYINKSSENIIAVVIGFIVLCAAGFVCWWRSGITRLYLDKVKEREIETLHKTIDGQMETMEEVVRSNAVLAQRLHRNDEKIKAMEKELLKLKSKILIGADMALGEDMAAILDQLEELKKEYALEAVQSKTLPATGVPSVDAMLSHMLDIAVADGIIFDLIVTGSIRQMVEDAVPKGRLETLIGDHVKDAIIAINKGDKGSKSILAHIGLVSGCYEFSAKDTGSEFEIDTLLELGIYPVTTHKDTGGSGWGFMTTFDTMRETKASLIITEFAPGTNHYTKKIAIRFDGKNEYIVESYRANSIKSKYERAGMIIRPIVC